MALRLAEEGCRVLGCDIDLVLAKSVADRISERGGQALAVQADVVDCESAGDVVKRTLSHFGHLHILVNNAEFSRNSPVTALIEQAWDSWAAAGF